MKALWRYTILIVCCAGGIGWFPAFSSALPKPAGCALEVEDFRGKKLVFERPVSRIVCLLDSALTGLYMLNAEATVIGVSASAYTGSSAPYYAAMDRRIREKSLPVVSSSMAGSLERIVALRPELVIVWSLSKETISALEERKIPVFGVFIDSVEDIYKEVLALGEITGRHARAHELVAFTKGQVGDIEKRIATVPDFRKPDVYFMWAKGALDSGGGRSIVQQVLDMSGARNICGHIDQEHVVISMEHLLVADPQVIVMWYNVILDPEDLRAKRAWRGLSAVENKRTYEIPDLFACDLCTLNFQYSLKLIAGWCHPEAFGEVDAADKATGLFHTLFSGKLPRHLIAERLSAAESNR